MPEHFQTNSRRAVQIGLEGERFTLLVPGAQQPLYGQRTRCQADGYARVLEPASGESQAGLQARGSYPAGLDHLAAMRAGSFHPAQGLGPSPVVVRSQAEIPQPDQSNRTNCVDQEEAPHNLPLMRMVRLRVQKRQPFWGIFLIAA